MATPTAPTTTVPRPVAAPAPRRAAPDRRASFLAVTTVVFFITTVIFGLMALAPSSAPIKTGATQKAAQVSVGEKLQGVATSFTEGLINFHYRTIDADIVRIERDTTRAFSQQFQGALHGDINVYRKRIADAQAISRGDVKGTTLLSADDGTGSVLVFATQTLQSASQPDPVTKYVLLELTVVDTPAGWKVDNARLPAKTTGGTPTTAGTQK
jgi:hypothetical protein